MYTYTKYAPLNIPEILKRVSEEEIFSIVIQQDIVTDKGVLYKAPYRDDKIGDCYFERYQGKLWFVDFGKGGRPGLDCFQFIRVYYNVSFKETLQIINKTLKLGLGDSIEKTKKTTKGHGYVEEKIVSKVFKKKTITFIPRKFNYKDKKFWSKYEISSENLLEDKVFAVELYQGISKKGKKFSIRPFDICYAYTEFFSTSNTPLKGFVKIYRPHASKDAKWFTNCNQNNIGSISKLPKKGKILVITKSYKDCRVLRNQNISSIWFQNEGMIPNKKILKNLLKRFNKIYIWFDNDRTGITSARIIKEYMNGLTISNKVNTIFLPPVLLSINIKDPSDYIAVKGKTALNKFLINNKLKQ